MRSKIIVFAALIPMILAACNLPSGAAGQGGDFDAVSTYAAQTVAASVNQNQPTATSQPIEQQPGAQGTGGAPTATSQPPQAGQPTATSIPCNRASFVEDVTVPDNASIVVGKAFIKTWKLKNVGSCAWTSGYSLVFDSGDQMGGPASQQLTNGTVAPGQTIEISVNLVAPNSPGTYKGNWKLKDPNGAIFALSTGPFWVQIKAAAAPDWPTFKKGDSGNEVYAIQCLLVHHGQTPAVDGIFGNETQSEVEDFQTVKNLKEDGIVGPETWQNLIVAVKQGDTGPAVRAAQQLLKGKFGFNAVTVDGIFGPVTAQAVKDFQSSKGIASDGIVGPITWQKLIND
ncbi:MAG: hypothetical protein AMXMBFR60_05210 [Chloroflexota bacterium]|nr:peptidoglycan-binding protein [Anaerolineales bacterium]